MNQFTRVRVNAFISYTYASVAEDAIVLGTGKRNTRNLVRVPCDYEGTYLGWSSKQSGTVEREYIGERENDYYAYFVPSDQIKVAVVQPDSNNGQYRKPLYVLYQDLEVLQHDKETNCT